MLDQIIKSIQNSDIVNIADAIIDDFQVSQYTRFVFCGVGKTYFVSERLAASYQSVGINSTPLHATEALHGDLGKIHKNDICILFSHSGNTPEMVTLANALKTKNCHTVLITSNNNAKILDTAQQTYIYKCQNGLTGFDTVPSLSLYVMQMIFDILLCKIGNNHSELIENFTKNHPGGGIGERLAAPVGTKMRPLSTIAVDSTMDLESIGDKFNNNSARMVALIKKEVFQGCLSGGDFRRLQKYKVPSDKLGIEHFNKSPLSVTSNTSVAEVISIMKKNLVDVIFVTKKNIIIGYVEMRQLL